MKKVIYLGLLLFIIAGLTSCLTVEKKEYTFEFTGKNKGTLTIKYYNIMSIPDYGENSEEEGENQTASKDFETLLLDYLAGNKIENDYPLATNVRKRLYEENGVLCGEVKMDFNSLEAVRLYQFDKKSPIMFSVSSSTDGESFHSTNGVLGNSEFMNVVFWKPGTKKLTVTTTVTTPDESSVSLLPNYKAWKNK